MFACDQTPHIPNQPDREREWKQKEKRKEKGWEYFEDEHLFNVRHRLFFFFMNRKQIKRHFNLYFGWKEGL
jgi:hypothetical protein